MFMLVVEMLYAESKIKGGKKSLNYFFVDMNCTGGREYQECGPNCGQTCRKQEPEGCTAECVPGCNCPEVRSYSKYQIRNKDVKASLNFQTKSRHNPDF